MTGESCRGKITKMGLEGQFCSSSDKFLSVKNIFLNFAFHFFSRQESIKSNRCIFLLHDATKNTNLNIPFTFNERFWHQYYPVFLPRNCIKLKLKGGNGGDGSGVGLWEGVNSANGVFVRWHLILPAVFVSLSDYFMGYQQLTALRQSNERSSTKHLFIYMHWNVSFKLFNTFEKNWNEFTANHPINYWITRARANTLRRQIPVILI